jgi:SAM-dependent methyltransferase
MGDDLAVLADHRRRRADGLAGKRSRSVIANTPQAWNERAKNKDSYEAVLWSPLGQLERFRAVIDALAPEPGQSLLDYGCGTGALVDHLPEGIKYTGVDWAPGMIARALTDHPGERFELIVPTERFDLTAVVGTFNLDNNWTKKRTWTHLQRLWAGTEKRMAVSLYSGRDPDCLSYHRSEAMLFAREIKAYEASVWQIRHNDVLLVLAK